MENMNKTAGADTATSQSCFEVFDNIMGALREPIVVLDADLKVVKANHSFYQMFHIKPDETEGTLIYDLGNRQWDIPKLRELLEEVIPEHAVFNDFEVEHTFETIGRKIMLLNASPICTTTSRTQMYHWPGIVRELENVLERAVINSSGPKLRLVDELKKPSKDLAANPKTLEAVERNYILQVLAQTGWKVSGKDSAAEILGLDRSTLRARMGKLNIRKP